MIVGAVLFGVCYGILHIRAQRNWCIDLSTNTLTYQAPSDRIGNTIEVKLNDIVAIKQMQMTYSDTDSNDQERWYLSLRNGGQIELFGHSPLDHEAFRDALLASNSAISFHYFLFKDDSLVKES